MGCDPLFQRFRGLDIIVAVDEGNRLAWDGGAFGINQWRPIGRNQLNPEIGGRQSVSHPFGGSQHGGFRARIRANARNAKQGFKLI